MQIERRHYRYKNAVKTFFCPLCATERSFRLKPRLNTLNHLQLVLLTGASTWGLYSWLGFKTLFTYFIYWAIFEFSVRVLYRKDVACPHCGFDASWYKRDVKVARRLVKDFWDKQKAQESNPETVESETTA
jgi:hypothetical protein